MKLNMFGMFHLRQWVGRVAALSQSLPICMSGRSWVMISDMHSKGHLGCKRENRWRGAMGWAKICICLAIFNYIEYFSIFRTKYYDYGGQHACIYDACKKCNVLEARSRIVKTYEKKEKPLMPLILIKLSPTQKNIQLWGFMSLTVPVDSHKLRKAPCVAYICMRYPDPLYAS